MPLVISMKIMYVEAWVRPRQLWVQAHGRTCMSMPGPCRGDGATDTGCHVSVITVKCRARSREAEVLVTGKKNVAVLRGQDS